MTDMCYASGINPSAIPGDNLRPDEVEAAAATLTAKGGAVRENGAEVVREWRALASHYEAPEAEQLLAVMDDVETKSREFGDAVESVATALRNFAADIRPIKAALAAVRRDAYAFRSRINADPEWEYDQGLVDENTALIGRVNAQQVALWEAERRCANAIRALYCAAPWRAMTSENDPLGYGVDQLPTDAQMPWGSAVDRKDHCPKAAAVEVKRFVWDGVAVEGVWGTVEGLGLLVGIDGNGFSLETLGSTWNAIGSLVGLGDIPPGEAWKGLGSGIIMADAWAEGDYGRALGGTLFNVVTVVVPGGAAVSAIKGGSTAGRTGRVSTWLTKGANALDFVDPIALGIRGGRLAAPTITSLFNGFTDGLRGLELPDFSPRVGGDAPRGGTTPGDGPLHEAPAGGGRTDYDAPEGQGAAGDAPPLRDPDAQPVREQPATTPVAEPVPVGANGVVHDVPGSTGGGQSGGSGTGGSQAGGSGTGGAQAGGSGTGGTQPGGSGTSPQSFTEGPTSPPRSADPSPSGGGTATTNAPTGGSSSGGSGPAGGGSAATPTRSPAPAGGNLVDDAVPPGSAGDAPSPADELPTGAADDLGATPPPDDLPPGDAASSPGGDGDQPGRVVIDEAGEPHVTHFRDDLISGEPHFRDHLSEALTSRGMTEGEFTELVQKPVTSLSRDEVTTLLEIREAMPAVVADDVMQKIVPPAAARTILGESLSRFAEDSLVARAVPDSRGFHSVGGFVARAVDAHGLTPTQIFDDLGLRYNDVDPTASPFAREGESMFAVRYRAGDAFAPNPGGTPGSALTPDVPNRVLEAMAEMPDEILDVPAGDVRHAAMREWLETNRPESVAEFDDVLIEGNLFRGNGYGGEGPHLAPELTYGSRFAVPEGAELFRIRPDGTQELAAVYRANDWYVVVEQPGPAPR